MTHLNKKIIVLHLSLIGRGARGCSSLVAIGLDFAFFEWRWNKTISELKMADLKSLWLCKGLEEPS